ncbi:MAG: 5-(carboxyamino)imidazole ribonucleotide mutase [Candidatus Omnitrophota bacterium]|nr:5-(carboxyamino)imidazole ribonucleotide mutase [Candidatus Omnitrophota bacterium]
MKKPQVSIVMGSDSDLPVMKEASGTLDKFGISHEVKIFSAHRSPDKTSGFAKRAKNRGVKVVIAGAGGAAHLAGVIAAHTTLPVIGVPMETRLDGMDSLLSTVQMPSGVPVATVSIGKAGAVNAAILAVQILGVNSVPLTKKLREYKRELVRKIEAKNRKVGRGK